MALWQIHMADLFINWIGIASAFDNIFALVLWLGAGWALRSPSRNLIISQKLGKKNLDRRKSLILKRLLLI